MASMCRTFGMLAQYQGRVQVGAFIQNDLFKQVDRKTYCSILVMLYLQGRKLRHRFDNS
jgi:hypothetical protein